MIRAIALTSLLALSVGCATTNTRETIKPSAAQMIGDFETRESARFSHLADTDRDGRVEADVHVCVAPSGHVASARVVKSSGSSEFDSAVERDVAKSTYRAFAAPADVKVCNDLRLVVGEG